MARFAVIGSNCFTGSHFVDALLARGDDVLAISRSPESSDLYLPYKSRSLKTFRFEQADMLRTPEKLIGHLDAFAPGAVINVAALSEVALSNHRPLDYFQTNTVGVAQLAHALKGKPYLKRYLHISSAEIYGSCDTPILEEAPLHPSTPYAVSKAAADMYLMTLAKNFQFPVTLIRSTNVYGKHQQLFKIIPRTVIYVKQGKKIELHGGGRAVKSFIHIRDVVQGALKVLEAAHPSEIYHFSKRSPDTIADVVRHTIRWMGKDPEAHVLIVGERLGQDAQYALDYSKAQRELGWSPDTPFEAGVRETIEWIDREWPRIQKEPLEYIHRF
jgi:dTDP-glucose 4,6-dehydratase